MVMMVVAACGQDTVSDGTAEVVVDDAAIDFALQACGVDEATFVMAGMSAGGELIQVVVGVTPDGESGFVADIDEVGISIEYADHVYEAFTPLAWTLRGESDPAPGRVQEAAIRGSRLSLDVVAEPADDSGAANVAVAVEARCDGDDLA